MANSINVRLDALEARVAELEDRLSPPETKAVSEAPKTGK